LAAPITNTESDISNSTKLKHRSVSMALDGAWCLFTVERYFGSQPSTEAWYRVRDEPAIEVINDNTKARTSITTTIAPINRPA